MLFSLVVALVNQTLVPVMGCSPGHHKVKLTEVIKADLMKQIPGVLHIHSATHGALHHQQQMQL